MSGMADAPKGSGASEIALAAAAAVLAVVALGVGLGGGDGVAGGVKVVAVLGGVLLLVVAGMAGLTAYAKRNSR